MAEKVLSFRKDPELYKKIAEKKTETEDYLSALGCLFSALKIEKTADLYSRIADVYSEMGHLEYANKYWFRYLSVAGKDDLSIAYTELAMNFFYMDNLWKSGYYFRKKIDVDGFIAKDTIDPEVLEFFSGEEIKKQSYKIVYPHNLADYSFELKQGKRAIASGDFSEAVNILSKIPSDGRTEEMSGDLAIALFMDEKLDDAEKVCLESIEKDGENITALCNLSTVSDMKKDYKSSEYYYKKALEIRTGDLGEVYKIATCAIEREDHEEVKKCLEKILEDSKYNDVMSFFYGISLMNTEHYADAVNAFRLTLKISPDDIVTEFYLEFALDMERGEKDINGLLPLKYNKEIPEKTATKWHNKILDLVKNPAKIPVALKNKETRKIVVWGITEVKEELYRKSIYVLSNYNYSFFIKTAHNILLENDYGEKIKRLLVYVMLLKGYKGKINVVANDIYLEYNSKKLRCEKDPDGVMYFMAYALCVARIMFVRVEGNEKIASVADKVYAKLSKKISAEEVTTEELAGLILSECNFERESKEEFVMDMFDTGFSKLKKLKELYKQK